ncbi:MAG: trypsin-like peptidase domain-containing protein [Eubacterium sp.]|nr:trypsin-like peptidase domain-containing protein [Eubacterium sp.]
MSDEYNSNSLNQEHKVEPIDPRGDSSGQTSGGTNIYDYGNTGNYSGQSGYGNTSGYSGQSGYNGTSGYFANLNNKPDYSYDDNRNNIYRDNASSDKKVGAENKNNINREKKSANKKVNSKSKSKDSFAKKLGLTSLLALVFGLVAGGVFQGINYGADKLKNRGQEIQSEADAEDEYSALEDDDNDKEDIDDKGSDSEEVADANTDESQTEEIEDSQDEESQEDLNQDLNQEENHDEISITDNSGKDGIEQQEIVQGSSSATLEYDVSDIVEMAQPSIVSITTAGTEVVQSFFQQYERPTAGAGSGIIIGQNEDSLYIATNYHVIQGANEIKVGFNDGEVVDATVQGYDESADIAVVLVSLSDMKDSTKDAVTVACVGDSSSLQVGEPAIAIGNALGYGQSVTVGYISALNRSIEGSEGTFIQTDAAINPGNSGGALINSKGQVIGINSVKYVDSTVEGMGFSIPINLAMTIINDIVSGEQKQEAYLGISGVDITKEYSMVYGFPMGIYVKDIESGSVAESSDLHTGDIIVEFDGQEVYTSEELQSLIKSKTAGDTIEMVVYRADDMGQYEKVTVSITF